MAATHTTRLAPLVVLVAVTGAAALAATVSPSAGVAATPTPSSLTVELATSAGVIESELTQLAEGRGKLKVALAGVAACTVSPSAAARQLVAVIANRTSISGQLSALPAPTAEASHVKALLESAL